MKSQIVKLRDRVRELECNVKDEGLEISLSPFNLEKEIQRIEEAVSLLEVIEPINVQLKILRDQRWQVVHSEYQKDRDKCIGKLGPSKLYGEIRVLNGIIDKLIRE